MQRVKSSRNAAIDKHGQGKNGFRAGDPQTGVAATTPGYEFFDAIQEEVATLIESTGETLDENKYDQLKEAVSKLAQNVNDEGLTAHIAAADPHKQYVLSKDSIVVYASLPTEKKGGLIYVELVGLMKWNGTEYVDINLYNKTDFVGTIFATGSSSAQAGCVLLQGQSINAEIHPKCAAIFGSHFPDMCAMSLRGCDNGRGIDVGRELLSYQEDAIQNFTGNFYTRAAASTGASNMSGDGALFSGEPSSVTGNAIATDSANRTFKGLSFDVSKSGARTSDETRIKNVAVNFYTILG